MGNFVVRLETAGGNQSFHTRKPFDPDAADLLFVLTDDGDTFVIPTSAIDARMSLTLHERYDRYRQGR